MSVLEKIKKFHFICQYISHDLPKDIFRRKKARLPDTSHKRSIDSGHVRLTHSTSSVLRGSLPGTTPRGSRTRSRPWPTWTALTPPAWRKRTASAGPTLIDKQTAHVATRRPLDAFLSPRFIRRTLPFSTPLLPSQTPLLFPPTSLCSPRRLPDSAYPRIFSSRASF